MRDIWFVDSVDAEAFHLFPDCPALMQAVQPIAVEAVTGLAEVIGTERYGDLRPCSRCRDRADAESAGEIWADRLASASNGAEDALQFLTQGSGVSEPMAAGFEPLRVFQQNLVKLKVFVDRFEIKQPGLFGGGEPAVIPFAEVREVRAVSWIPVVRAPAIEIDSELDGEIFTDRFEMSVLDSPKMVVAAVEDVIASAAPQSPPSGAAGSADSEDAGEQAEGGPLPEDGGAVDYGDGIRGELARLYDEGRKHGGAFFDGSGAGLGGAGMSGWDFADGVMAGCNDAESLKNLAERLDEAVRLARFFVEANAIPTTNPKRWNKLVVTIGDCDIDWELKPYKPGGPDDPFIGGGGGGGQGGGSGAGGKPGPTKKKPAKKKPPKRDPDQEWLRLHFPNMDYANAKITGPRGRYNCAGHVLSTGKETWPTQEHGTAVDKKDFDAFLAKNGWVDDPNGDRSIALWGPKGKGITHVSRYLGNARHESKFNLAGLQVEHSESDMVGSKGFLNMEPIERRVGRVVGKPVKNPPTPSPSPAPLKN